MSTIPDAVFARFKAVTGGARWDTLHTLREHGTLHLHSLSGTWTATRDLATGRSTSRHVIGPLTGAAGYDGITMWQRGPGGEIALLDAPEAKRRARSQAWLDAFACWYPQRLPATLGAVGTQQLDGLDHHVVTATPDGGDPLTLWFARSTGLLVRIVRQRGGSTVTTTLDDYRDVASAGVRVPFHIATDRTDANGQRDPRQCTQIVLDAVDANAPVTDGDFAPPVMAPALRIDTGTTRVPFDLVNHHLYVDARVNGEPVRLMVDTGGANLLTPAAAQRLGLDSAGRLAASGPGERRTDAALARAKTLQLGDATLADPVFYVVDLGELAAAEGVAFDGLVGYEMFRRCGVVIDYASRTLVLAEPAQFTPPPGATVLPFTFDRLTPIVTGTLDGLPVRLTVDTGSRASLTLAAPYVHAHGLVERYAAAPECVLGWGVGGAVRMRPARFPRLRLGDIDVDGVVGDLYTGTAAALTNPDHAGNLGGGVLRRFIVAFDYAAGLLHLAPNAAFGIPDAFDRSGLWLLARGDMLDVADVAPGSAAAHAGLVTGDRIATIDGAPVAARTLAQWRERLRELPAGTPVALFYVRDGSTHAQTLVLADRL